MTKTDLAKVLFEPVRKDSGEENGDIEMVDLDKS